MPATPAPPLSSTVKSIFDEFIEKLKKDNVLGAAATAALAECLYSQKLDHESLRAALFKADGSHE